MVPHLEFGGGNPVISPFRIEGFTNNRPFNEKGIPVTDVAFNWGFLNGVPTTQSISPLVGDISNPQLSTDIIGQNITGDTTFTLTASDGVATRRARTAVLFYYPIFYGSVSGIMPTEAEILSMNKHVAGFAGFTASINVSDRHSCFVSPMTNPIKDIREPLFNLSILSTYIIYDNFFITMADGLLVPCRVLVKAVPEHTLGQNMDLVIEF